MKANTTTNERFFDLQTESERGTKEFYIEVKKQGFKYMYMWINSDESWKFFATNEARAKEGAIELYCEEKNADRKEGLQYFSEYVDIIDIDTIINEWF